MRSTTFRLMRNELRMLFNQFKQAITIPSMVLFYGVTIIGVFFVSLVISSLLSFAPMMASIGVMMEEFIDRGMFYGVFAILSASSVITGYFGLGPAAIITSEDESLLLPAPVKPHQIFLSRYTRRIVRKMAFMVIGLIAILPLLTSAHILFLSIVLVLLCVIVFFETNYFLGSLSSFIRLSLEKRYKSPLRHIVVLLLGFVMIVPAYPLFTSTFTAAFVFPSNALALVITEMTGIFSLNVPFLLGVGLQIMMFTIFILLTACICGYDYYEVFSASKGSEEIEGRFSKVIRGDIDFSNSRFNDPIIWIMLKDFWSRLRSPFQIWKYVYAVVGTIFVLYLNILHPPWFRPLNVPPNLAFAVVPAFALMLILLIQMSSITSMLSFVDEKDNVYLLKASPFKSKDIVLAKFLLSFVEVGIAAIPACGFLIYIMRIEGYLALITLAAPLVILFTATGVAIGAYVPVMTNDPKTLPVPLAFSYPIINLSLGAAMILVVALFADSVLVLIVLPVYCLGLTLFFLATSVRALDSYK
ncbi:MAG: hypothetical protein E4H14_02490 [Candidatus Thorarchaeota archaeon]|nr:MAG: hypothetical protein E4H14_02490 [Candidatus Thorarchaeota archaeon]